MTARPPPAIEFAVSSGRASLPFLKRLLPFAVARVTTCRLTTLSIVLVGDATMSRLHARFFGVSGPTDVITFELEHDPRGRPTSGEVVCCVPEARRQAALRGTKIERELLLYALHGVLHLSGYDDLEPAAHRRMHLAEDRILKHIGVGAVYRDTTRRPY